MTLELAVKTDGEIPGEIAKGTFDLAIGGCPDPMAHSFFIQSVFLFSKSPYALGGTEEFDRRLLEVAGTLDLEEQGRKARALDGYVHEEALSLFTYQRIKTYGVRRDVALDLYLTGMPFFHDAKRLQETPAGIPDP